SNPGLFKSLAESAPAYVDRKMRTTGTARPATRTSTKKDVPEYIGMTNEDAVTAYFSKLVLAMDAEVTEYNESCGRSRPPKTEIPACEYHLVDHQSKAIKGGSGLKVDFAFYYPGSISGFSSVHILLEAKKEEYITCIHTDTLKQLADYQTNIWQTQPSRAYVPILLLHGAALTLVIFTRNNWYVADIGHFCYRSVDFLSSVTKAVRLVMVRLYFLLTLTPEEFGHCCGVFEESSCWRFSHISAKSMDATAEISDEHDPHALQLVRHMQRAVYPRHRLAHIYEAEYGGESVFLKLSWVPVDVVPEGAVYELLEQAGVDNIPKVFLSGVLVKNMFGYRLEFLVLEHCGSSIEEHLPPIIGEPRSADPTFDKVRVVVSGTLRCLAQAYVLCAILHRDISMGNVRVNRRGQVKVIDWGYGKLLPVDGLSDEAIRHRGAVLMKWEFVGDAASTTNKPLTGTPYYMSIPVLSAATARGPMDEIESTFYVVLHALSTLESSKDPIVCAFDYHENRNLAMVRVGCLARESRFLEFFGVKNVSCELRQLLYKYRKYLFVDNGEYIAPDLVIDPYTPRGNNPELLSGYIDEETMDLLKQLKSA
ncbi:hypothetical protein GGI09_006288, partial [Coemansia sp. S100]